MLMSTMVFYLLGGTSSLYFRLWRGRGVRAQNFTLIEESVCFQGLACGNNIVD